MLPPPRAATVLTRTYRQEETPCHYFAEGRTEFTAVYATEKYHSSLSTKGRHGMYYHFN